MSNNPLEELGLNLDTAIGGDVAANLVSETEAKAAGNTASTGGTAPAEAAPAKAARAPRVEVNVGEIVVSTEFESLAPLVRGGGGGATGSKYKFDELLAPAQQADGSWGYTSFLVELQEGVDEDALKRSVQSANTQANANAKKAGEPNYYVTRSVVKDGKFVGMKVYRVDNTIAKD